ncbi:methylated-DNA--[protein]-cysteine S-methyltransferase [Nibrella viscosa]|uniref:Methylated-DNA--[protein]-cysteine S-methyltransferase n=1 Tax=Nibrella viscosa TaxID=1084524 RepID=A0ABP8KH81_9BACT
MQSDQVFTYRQITTAIEHLTAHFREQPSLASLAGQVNLSEFHFQRLFSEWAGVSPKKFGQYLTLSYAKEQLRTGVPLAEAAYGAGLSGTGRLHDLFVRLEGVTPGEFKRGGQGLQLVYGVFESRFGAYLLGTINGKICVLHFLQEADEPVDILNRMWPEATLHHDPAALQPLTEQIFPAIGVSAPIRPLHVLVKGSPFQLKVWEALLRIPEGRLVSYDAVAEAIGQPAASRAVGTAIGSNPVGYLIPCHRVIRKTGLFGGYRWGLVRKQAILGWEAAHVNG